MLTVYNKIKKNIQEVLNANRIKIEEIDQNLLKIDRKLDRMHDKTIKIDAEINILKEECNKLLEEQLKIQKCVPLDRNELEEHNNILMMQVLIRDAPRLHKSNLDYLIVAERKIEQYGDFGEGELGE